MKYKIEIYLCIANSLSYDKTYFLIIVIVAYLCASSCHCIHLRRSHVRSREGVPTILFLSSPLSLLTSRSIAIRRCNVARCALWLLQLGGIIVT